ncbi:MAG: hypothetical protein AB4911_24470 [Oscillochloridaceae bacterium umkhey_bin13]
MTAVIYNIDQMAPFLCSIILQGDAELRTTVCKGLANAYRVHPDKVASILEGWLNEWSTVKISNAPCRNPDPAEEIMTAVVLVLSYLSPTEMIEPLSQQRVSQIKQQVLAHVSHPSIRITIFTTMLQQVGSDSQPLHRFLVDIRKSEYDHVLRLLTESYIEQRRSLADRSEPDLVRPIEGNPTPLWWNEHQRPQTANETLLRSFLIESDDQHLQKLAFQAMMTFTEQFDTKVEQELAQVRMDRQREQERQRQRRTSTATESLWDAAPTPVSAPQSTSSSVTEVHDFYLTYLVPLLATRATPHYRDIVYKLLPQVLAYDRQHPELLKLRLTLWERGGDAELVSLARCMRDVIGLAPLRYWAIREVGAFTLLIALRELWRENVLQDVYRDFFIHVLFIVIVAVICIPLLGIIVWLF